jgi:hypothetical protein
MSEYERDAETDVFRTGDTAHKTIKQKLTPHTDYNWLYVVLLYYLCTASRLHASMSNFLKYFGCIGTKIAAVTKERVALRL